MRIRVRENTSLPRSCQAAVFPVSASAPVSVELRLRAVVSTSSFSPQTKAETRGHGFKTLTPTNGIHTLLQSCLSTVLHLKMMRLLFLCLLLLLPAATAVSEESEGSAEGELDDEDLNADALMPGTRSGPANDSDTAKATGEDQDSDQFTMIVIIVAATALTLSVAAIVTIMLVRRHMHKPQHGVYSVPTEQEQKAV
ncbi:uncharacterized protein AB9X84_024173 isoform 1-T1 [Acanthopagrus schlegelii]